MFNQAKKPSHPTVPLKWTRAAHSQSKKKKDQKIIIMNNKDDNEKNLNKLRHVISLQKNDPQIPYGHHTVYFYPGIFSSL